MNWHSRSLSSDDRPDAGQRVPTAVPACRPCDRVGRDQPLDQALEQPSRLEVTPIAVVDPRAERVVRA